MQNSYIVRGNKDFGASCIRFGDVSSLSALFLLVEDEVKAVTMALVSPAKGRARSPVSDFHACWMEATDAERNEFDLEP